MILINKLFKHCDTCISLVMQSWPRNTGPMSNDSNLGWTFRVLFVKSEIQLECDQDIKTSDFQKIYVHKQQTQEDIFIKFS